MILATPDFVCCDAGCTKFRLYIIEQNSGNVLQKMIALKGNFCHYFSAIET